MHIELTEFLRCPERHGTRSYCVLMPETMVKRDVRTGVIACPECQATYPIVDGIADFREPAVAAAVVADTDVTTLPAADDVQALLGIVGPGGYVVVLGSACRLASDLGQLLPGVHFVLVNPPADLPNSGSTSRILCRGRIPLAPSMARGVLIGQDHAGTPSWLDESARLLLRGLRMVVLGAVDDIHGVRCLASERGMWVGEKA